MSVGLLLVWIDSSPNWDDSGITAALLFGTSVIFGFSMPRFAWLWAILDGMWIPLNAILLHRQYGMVIVCMIAFVGAYSGVFIQKIFKSVTATTALKNGSKGDVAKAI